MLDFIANPILSFVAIFGTLYLILMVCANYFRNISYRKKLFNNYVENIINEVLKKNFVINFKNTNDGRLAQNNNLPFKPISNIYFNYYDISKSYEIKLKNNLTVDLELHNFFTHNAKEVISLFDKYGYDLINKKCLTGYEKIFPEREFLPDLKFIKKKHWYYEEFLYVRTTFYAKNFKNVKKERDENVLFCIDRNLDCKTNPRCFNEKTLQALKDYLIKRLN